MVDAPTPENKPERLSIDSAAQELESFDFPSFDEVEQDKKSPAKKSVAKAPAPQEDESPEPLDPDESEDVVDEDSDADTDTDEAVDPDADDSEDTDDEPEVEDKAAKEPPKHRVKVRGEEIEVTQDELYAGYSRQADYTRSKQELAAEKAKFEKEEIPVVRERAVKYAEGLKQIEEALKALQPAEPDWDKLYTESPETFANQRALWQLQQDRIKAVEEARKTADAQVQQDQMEARKARIRAESEKLFEMIPSWKDEKIAKKEKVEIANYAKSLGFTDSDLSSIELANAMVVLRNAYLYDKSQKAKPAIQRKIEKVKAATPGARDEARPEVSKQTRRLQRLAKTHSIKDAASVLENMEGLLD